MTRIASDPDRSPRRNWAAPSPAGRANLTRTRSIEDVRSAAAAAHRARAALLIAFDSGEITIEQLLDLCAVDSALAKIRMIDVLLCCKGWSRATGLRAIARLTHGRYTVDPALAKVAWLVKSNANPARRAKFADLCRQHDQRTLPWIGWPFEPPIHG